MKPLSPVMLHQLRLVAAGRATVRLPTIRALMDRGLIADTKATRHSLHIHCRLASAYPLTTAGRQAVEAEDFNDSHFPVDRV